MYDEDAFKSQIFWIKVRRVFFMLVFSLIGSAIGVAISFYLITVLLSSESLRIPIVAGSTLLFFAISLLITANTGKEIQDGYWKIAVLRKLTLISKKLDSLEKIEDLDNILQGLDLNSQKIINNIPTDSNVDSNVSDTESTDSTNSSTPVNETNTKKSKVRFFKKVNKEDSNDMEKKTLNKKIEV